MKQALLPVPYGEGHIASYTQAYLTPESISFQCVLCSSHFSMMLSRHGSGEGESEEFLMQFLVQVFAHKILASVCPRECTCEEARGQPWGAVYLDFGEKVSH